MHVVLMTYMIKDVGKNRHATSGQLQQMTCKDQQAILTDDLPHNSSGGGGGGGETGAYDT